MGVRVPKAGCKALWKDAESFFILQGNLKLGSQFQDEVGGFPREIFLALPEGGREEM